MKRTNGRNHGEVFTKLNIVKYLLDEVKYLSTENLKSIRILEPSSGYGIFAIEIIHRLIQSSIRFKFDFIEALNNNVQFVEVNKKSFIQLKKNVFNAIKEKGFAVKDINHNIFLNIDYLQSNINSNFECIAGNPPYIRHEVIDIKLKNIYKNTFSTFKYRADLYIPFYEKSLSLLSENGVLSFVCSNRWLFNQYGQPLRELIAKKYHLTKLINIEKANIFDEEVTAYPCITTIKNSIGHSTKFYETQEKEININTINFIQKDMPKDQAWQNLFLNYDINHTHLIGIEEQNFKIGIGIATGADKIFIKKIDEINEIGIETSRIVPIIKSKSLTGNKIDWDNSYLINPFEKNNICNLEKFPKLKKYFNQHKNSLLKRHIVKKNPKNWYRTIDKIKPDLQNKYKLLLPDLSGSKFLFIDNGAFYPHHNVYYITHENLDELQILACILMSDFIKNQLSQIGIRMNGGLPRFQSQTLKKLRIPNLKKLHISDRKILINAYKNKNLKEINKIVNQYCVPITSTNKIVEQLVCSA